MGDTNSMQRVGVLEVIPKSRLPGEDNRRKDNNRFRASFNTIHPAGDLKCWYTRHNGSARDLRKVDWTPQSTFKFEFFILMF